MLNAPLEQRVFFLLASRPAPALRHLIRHYYQVQDSLVGRVSLQPVPARSPQILEFMFRTRYQVRRMDCETGKCAYRGPGRRKNLPQRRIAPEWHS